MKSVFKPLLIAGLMAGIGFSALAQSGPMGAMGGGMGGGMGGQGAEHRGMMGHHGMQGKGQMDPAKMEERMAARQAVLKVRLKITATQEAAWTAFTTAMKPSPDMLKRRADMHAEMSKLTMPERMDKMKSMRGERDAEMDKHAAAAKTLYAVLTPEQKKVFDTQPMRGGHERGHGRGHGGMHGDSGAQGGHGGHMAPPAAKS